MHLQEIECEEFNWTYPAQYRAQKRALVTL